MFKEKNESDIQSLTRKIVDKWNNKEHDAQSESDHASGEVKNGHTNDDDGKSVWISKHGAIWIEVIMKFVRMSNKNVKKNRDWKL